MAAIKAYGLSWPNGHNNLTIELAMFREKISKRMDWNQGGYEPMHHFKQVAKALWPEDLSIKTHVRFVWHPWADLMLERACKHKYLAVAGAGGTGKCLAPHTPVLFHDGHIGRADSVRVGHLLMGDDSTPRTVLAANPGRSNMVRIAPLKGDPWECNDDHILTLKKSWAHKCQQHTVGQVIDISVKDYISQGVTFKDQWKLFCTGVEFPEQPVEIDPRVYGMWLGDGSSAAPVITSPDSEKEVNEYFTSYFERMGYSIRKGYYGKSCPTWLISHAGKHRNPFFELIRESTGLTSPSDTSKPRKRILNRYLHNSRKVRMELLAGLLDTDGYTNGTYFEIACSHKGLDDDIIYLARSLGFRVVSSEKQVPLNGKMYRTTRIHITGDTWTIPTLRKKCRPKQRTDSTMTKFSVEQIGEGDWYGFQLDGNGRFLLGDFTVTHNSELYAIWAIICYLADPMHTTVLVTSNTMGAAKLRIWGKIVKYWEACERLDLPGKLVNSLSVIRYVSPEGKESDISGIMLVSIDKSKAKEATEKIQGIHNENVIFVGDELATMSESATQAAFYNLPKGCRRFQFIGLANPDSHSDTFGKFAKPKAGWHSITVESEEWETDWGLCIHLDGFKSPNFILGYKKYEFLPSLEELDVVPVDARNTAKFWQQWRGFWAPDGITDRVYSEVEVINSGAMDKAVWLNNDKIKIAAIDPSFVNGGDSTFACIATVGYAVDPMGLKILQFDEWIEFIEDITNTTKTRNVQAVEWFRKICTDRGIKPYHAGYDSTGGGSVWGDLLMQAWSREVFGLGFGKKASELPVSAYDPTPSHERYANMVTEIWYSGKEYMRANQIKGIDDRMMSEMCQRRLDPRGEKNLSLRIKVMPKSQMKAENGGVSPDYVEAAFIALALARERCGLDSGSAIKKQNPQNREAAKNWKSIFSKFSSAYKQS